ncbi:hypothetical protein D3C72_1141840 [compost metagenome]
MKTVRFSARLRKTPAANGSLSPSMAGMLRPKPGAICGAASMTSQTAMPTANPARAPRDRPPRHSTAPNRAGANWARAAKDTSPMAARPLDWSMA